MISTPLIWVEDVFISQRLLQEILHGILLLIEKFALLLHLKIKFLLRDFADHLGRSEAFFPGKETYLREESAGVSITHSLRLIDPKFMRHAYAIRFDFINSLTVIDGVLAAGIHDAEIRPVGHRILRKLIPVL